MTRDTKSRLFAAGLALFLVGAGGATVHVLSEQIVPYKDERPSDLEYIPGRRLLEATAFGYDKAMADLWWIESIQYFNDETLKPRRGDRLKGPFLSPMLQVITDLDPDFQGAYSFGNLFLRILRRYREAIEFLLKGEEHHPHAFLYPSEQGHTYYFDMGDREAGIQAYKRAMETADVTPFFVTFFQSIMSRRGEHNAILQMQLSNYERARDEAQRDYWMKGMKLTLAHRGVDRLKKALEERNAFNALPLTHEEVPGLHGLENVGLSPLGKAGDLWVYTAAPVSIGPIEDFQDILLVTPSTGKVQSFYLVLRGVENARAWIKAAVNTYLRDEGRLPPYGEKGMEELHASGHLRRRFTHPFGGGFTLSENGEIVSEKGWDRLIDLITAEYTKRTARQFEFNDD